jgi:hypothetical protein
MAIEDHNNLIGLANHLLDERRKLAGEMASGSIDDKRLERFFRVQVTLEAVLRAMDDEQDVLDRGAGSR